MPFVEYLGIFGTITGVLGIVAGGGFYLKYTGTKANLDGKDETIETLSRQRDAYRDENETLRSDVSRFKGENEVLKRVATQTPEIIALTKAVTRLTSTVESGNNKVIKLLSNHVKSPKE